MTPPNQDRETRYFIDLDLMAGEIVRWGFDQRSQLANAQVLDEPYHRIFISRGQFNKLDQRSREIRSRIKE